MRKRTIEIDLVDPAEQLAGQIAQYQKEQKALGEDRPKLSPELQEAYDGLSPDAIRRELAKVALHPIPRILGEIHIVPLAKL